MIAERMSLSLSENLLTLLAHSDRYGGLIANNVDAALFEGELRPMAEKIIAYWQTHRQAPKLHTPDLFAEVIEDPRNRRGATYQRILASMLQLNDEGINVDYVIQTMRNFLRVRAMQDAILRSAELLNSPKETTVAQVEEILGDLLAAQEYRFSPGTRLDEVDSLIAFLEKQYSEFDTGIKELDAVSAVPARGTLYTIMAGAGKGKTRFLIHLGMRALLLRQKVVHITLEVHEEMVKQLYYQALFKVSKRQEYSDVTEIKLDKSGDRLTLEGFVGKQIKPAFTLADPDRRFDLVHHIQWGLGNRARNILIKQIPTGMLTIGMLRGYLDSLEKVERFVPDMVIVDYPKLMNISLRDYRLGLGRVIADLRGIAIDRQVAMVIAHQISREGVKATVARGVHAGEDYSIVQTSDIIITYSATDAEQRYGLARLYADKVRNDRGNVAVMIAQSYDLGQFVLQSFPMASNYYQLRDEYVKKVDEDLDDDEDSDDDHSASD